MFRVIHITWRRNENTIVRGTDGGRHLFIITKRGIAGQRSCSLVYVWLCSRRKSDDDARQASIEAAIHDTCAESFDIDVPTPIARLIATNVIAAENWETEVRPEATKHNLQVPLTPLATHLPYRTRALGVTPSRRAWRRTILDGAAAAAAR